MTNEQFYKGVQIIAKNIPDSDKDEFDVNAGHEQIWFGEAKWITNPVDIKDLRELGWFISEKSWSCYP